MTTFENQSNTIRCFKTIGEYAGEKPASLTYRDDMLQLLVPVNHTFITYNVTRGIVYNFQSDFFEEKVLSVFSTADTYVVVTKHFVHFIDSQKALTKMEIGGKVFSSILIGEFLLVTTESFLHIISVSSKSEVKKLKMPCESPILYHSKDYVNKVLLVKDTQIFLYNFNTEKTLFTFTFSEKITSICQSPDVDIHAIALRTGEVVLFDLKKNKKIFSLQVASQPTSMCFLTGLPNDDLFLCVGDVSGVITILSVKTSALVGNLYHHTKAVHTLFSLPNELHFFSIGSDNAIRLFRCDPDSGILMPMLSTQLKGHTQTPNILKLYSDNSVITAAPDGSVRVSSLTNFFDSTEFGQRIGNVAQGSKKDKLVKTVTSIATNSRYHLLKGTVATTHLNTPYGLLWSVHNNALIRTRFIFSVKSLHSDSVNPGLSSDELTFGTSVCFSHCGNFVIYGSSNGLIDRFNVESGNAVCLYNHHTGKVTGVDCDVNDRFVVSSSSDGTVLLWEFETGKVLDVLLRSESPIIFFEFKKVNNLLLVVDGQNMLYVIDVTTRRVIRRLQLENDVSAIRFNAKGNMLFVAYTCQILEVYDVITMNKIDYVKTTFGITSMDISSNGQFLVATANLGKDVKVFLLRDFFSLILKTASSEPIPVSFNIEKKIKSYKEYLYDKEIEPMQIEAKELREIEKLLEMSDAKTTWRNLPVLDKLRKENQIEKGKTVDIEELPFFIPSGFTQSSKIFQPVKLENNLTTQPIVLQSILEDKLMKKNDDETLEYLKSLNSSKLDFEIRNLSHNEFALLDTFLEFLNRRLLSYRDYDFIITMTQVTMRTHIQELINERHKEAVKSISNTLTKLWKPVDALFNTDFSLVAFLSGISI
ncbi:WD-repeat protein, putative [Entamoeba invadens IP1]|uniref:WD-repeat protein, putative n=1 Tax=Entamoeba invadens IP1 TaxID=370355 RepID=A0A0A1UDP8_ENTIV|nr:WD-repeat protein, putative [Entamoeba invadens IP1]ELP90874.1 WD-repeat protein, putative [Entamoeba invadens IP1]|eukprot:XP_004257645.1 WD-repeat protein, putative [Entamoeba invadens IP1]